MDGLKKRSVMEIAADIEAKRREQMRLLMEMAVWEDVMAQLRPQGVLRCEDVASFGWHERYLGCPRDRWVHLREIAWRMAMGDHDRHARALRPGEEWVGPWLHRSGAPEWFNFVRLKDGRELALKPPVQAAHARTVPVPGGGA